MTNTEISARWGPVRGRSTHHDPVMHIVVEGDLTLCTGTPARALWTTTNDVPYHGCVRCIRVWKQQCENDDD